MFLYSHDGIKISVDCCNQYSVLCNSVIVVVQLYDKLCSVWCNGAVC